MLYAVHGLGQAQTVSIVSVAIVYTGAAVDRAGKPATVHPCEVGAVIPLGGVAYAVVVYACAVIGGEQVLPVTVTVYIVSGGCTVGYGDYVAGCVIAVGIGLAAIGLGAKLTKSIISVVGDGASIDSGDVAYIVVAVGVAADVAAISFAVGDAADQHSGGVAAAAGQIAVAAVDESRVVEVQGSGVEPLESVVGIGVAAVCGQGHGGQAAVAVVIGVAVASGIPEYAVPRGADSVFILGDPVGVVVLASEYLYAAAAGALGHGGEPAKSVVVVVTLSVGRFVLYLAQLTVAGVCVAYRRGAAVIIIYIGNSFKFIVIITDAGTVAVAHLGEEAVGAAVGIAGQISVAHTDTGHVAETIVVEEIGLALAIAHAMHCGKSAAGVDIGHRCAAAYAGGPNPAVGIIA